MRLPFKVETISVFGILWPFCYITSPLIYGEDIYRTLVGNPTCTGEVYKLLCLGTIPDIIVTFLIVKFIFPWLTRLNANAVDPADDAQERLYRKLNMKGGDKDE